MSKSKFAESLKGLTTEQFDRVAADMLSEAARRGTTSDDFARASTMSDREFEQFSQRAINATARSRAAAELARAASAAGKVLADPKAPENKNDGEQ